MFLKIDKKEKWNIIEDLVIRFAEKIDKAEHLHPSQIVLEMTDPDDILLKIIEDLKKYNIEYKHIKKRSYSKNELINAQYALMSVSTPWFQQGKYAEDFGAGYAPPICSECNNGKIQIGNIYIPEKKARKYDICSLLPEIIIGEKVQNILEEHKCSGYRLQDIYCYKSHTTSDLKQLIPINILPPMEKKSGAIMKKCPACNTDQIDYIFDEIVYKKTDFGFFADFNCTKELFSTKKSDGVPNGLCIVSNRIISLFFEYKVRNVQFEPVSFVDI